MNTGSIIRPELLTLMPEQFQALLPYFWIFGGTVLAILGCVLRSLKPKWPVILISLATLLKGIHSSFTMLSLDLHPVHLFNGMMVADHFSNFFNILFLSSAALTILSSIRYLDREDLQIPEFYVLLLFSALGMMIMASALDLIVIFIALELMSLSVYVLTGFRRSDRKSNEAAMKYFILGSAASAVLLYGSALLYGCTGSTGVREILTFATAHSKVITPVFALGCGLVLFGFLFKVASVPFHMWMPDVYEGAPTPVTGFMTTGLKAAAFATLIRVFISLGFGQFQMQRQIHDILWVSALLTMVVGNFVALTQTNLKRMLAYSSIAHTGYLIMGILAGSKSSLGFAPGILYLAVYAIMNLGAFVILSLLANRGDTGLELKDFSGVAKRQPWLAFAMAVFLFSMAGIPPTAGFAAKYLLFYSAIQAHEIPLVVIGVLCSAVSVYYYLRVLVYMYMRDPIGSEAESRVSIWSALAVTFMVFLTLQIGILPALFIDIAKKAMSSI